jgi:hypothetical protein
MVNETQYGCIMVIFCGYIYIYVHTYTSTDVSDGDIKLRCTWILPEIAKIKTYVVGVYPLLQSATFRF